LAGAPGSCTLAHKVMLLLHRFKGAWVPFDRHGSGSLPKIEALGYHAVTWRHRKPQYLSAEAVFSKSQCWVFKKTIFKLGASP
jgi:hypothetical protein